MTGAAPARGEVPLEVGAGGHQQRRAEDGDRCHRMRASHRRGSSRPGRPAARRAPSRSRPVGEELGERDQRKRDRQRGVEPASWPRPSQCEPLSHCPRPPADALAAPGAPGRRSRLVKRPAVRRHPLASGGERGRRSAALDRESAHLEVERARGGSAAGRWPARARRRGRRRARAAPRGRRQLHAARAADGAPLHLEVDQASAGAGLGEQRVELGQRGSGRAPPALVAAQHAEQPAQLVERLAADPLDAGRTSRACARIRAVRPLGGWRRARSAPAHAPARRRRGRRRAGFARPRRPAPRSPRAGAPGAATSRRAARPPARAT